MEYEEIKKASKKERQERAREVVLTALETDLYNCERIDNEGIATANEEKQDLIRDKIKKVKKETFKIVFDDENKRVFAVTDVYNHNIRIDD